MVPCTDCGVLRVARGKATIRGFVVCHPCRRVRKGLPAAKPRERRLRSKAPCTTCGDLRPVTPLSSDQVLCHPCRRKRRRLQAASRPQKPLTPQWNCEVCDVLVLGSSKSRGGRFCSRHRDHDKGHRRRARRYGVHYEYINPRAIYVRDGWRCGLCGKRVDQRLNYPHRMSPSLDHIVPISEGGDHAPVNVQCAHLKCNMVKGYSGGGEQLALVG